MTTTFDKILPGIKAGKAYRRKIWKYIPGCDSYKVSLNSRLDKLTPWQLLADDWEEVPCD